MSQAQRGPPGFGGGPNGQGYVGTGSVRRAREMLETGSVREARLQTFEPEGDRGAPGTARGASSKRNIVTAFTSRSNQKPPPTISRPTPIPQWPLRDEVDLRQETSKPPKITVTPNGPPPQRPPRPSNVPSLLDASKIQGTTPNFAYRPPQVPRSSEYEDRGQEGYVDPMEAYLSPPSTGKTPRISAESDTLGVSSPVGTIPDFPLPARTFPIVPLRASQDLLSERSLRGPSFPYSGGSYISTIREESEVSTRQANSFASSMAIPSSWGSERPESDVLGVTSPTSSVADSNDLRSPASNIEGESELVRQASIGKIGKPLLRTINRSGSGESVPQLEQTGIALGGPSVDGSPPTTPGARVSYARPNAGVPNYTPTSPSDNGTLYSPSDPDAPGARAISPTDMSLYSRSGLGVPDVSRYPSDVSGFDAPFMLDQSRRTLSLVPRGPDASRNVDMDAMRSPVEGRSSKRPDSRRPPRLNLDAVREAEARGSLTSLPDLIRRATRLASNLERGKTASRFGILDMFSYSNQEFKFPVSPAAVSERRASEAISGILSAFPPPAKMPRAMPNADFHDSWPLPQAMSDARKLQTSDSARGLTGAQPAQTSSSQQRRCCGLSRRVFLAIAVLIFVIIAVAVIVPVVLVLTRQKHTTQQASTTTATTTPAQQTFQCLNGGVTVYNSGSFSCVCANGFTGEHCAVAADGSCVTAAVGGVQNATLGSDLPRLLEQSESNFSIPLDSTLILSLFSSNNVSCTTENALVTFGDSSQKRRSLSAIPRAEDSMLKRKMVRSPTSDIGNVLLRRSRSASVSATSTQTSTASSTTTSAQASATSLSASEIRHILDFSRIAVLYIFEMVTSIDLAIEVQEVIQAFLTNMPDKNNTMGLSGSKMPQGFVLDFEKFTITLSNGTVVGGGTGG